MHQRHDAGDLAAEGAGVHHQSAADGAGNSLSEFESFETVLDDGLLDQRAEIHARRRR